MVRIKHRQLERSLSFFVIAALILTVLATAETPQISIIEPKEGAQIPAGNIMINASVKNFNLVNKLGAANVAGEGHIHYYVDALVPKVSGKPAITAAGTFVPTINTSFTWNNVKVGKHNVSVQLVNNDHTPLIPLEFSTINITVVNDAKKDPQNVTLGLIAKNMAFNASKIAVPAGAQVTLNFDNLDQDIPHNFAVYTDSSANTAIFIGKIITGSSTTTYEFKAPENPGNYYFRCDVHPSTMIGQFVVQ